MLFPSQLGHHQIRFYHFSIRFTSVHSFNDLWALFLMNYGWGKHFQRTFRTWMNYSASGIQSLVIMYHRICNKHGIKVLPWKTSYIWCASSVIGNTCWIKVSKEMCNWIVDFTLRKNRTEPCSNEVEYISKILLRFEMFLR